MAPPQLQVERVRVEDCCAQKSSGAVTIDAREYRLRVRNRARYNFRVGVRRTTF
jgi:hypothetical protein